MLQQSNYTLQIGQFQKKLRREPRSGIELLRQRDGTGAAPGQVLYVVSKSGTIGPSGLVDNLEAFVQSSFACYLGEQKPVLLTQLTT